MNIIKKYIEYLKDNPEGYWFKRKVYGWGWAPATKEGWLVTAVFVVAVVWLALRLDANTTDAEAMKELILPLIGLLVIFISIAYKKGEKPKWMWGFPKKDKLDF